ncbi:hypothetical protein AgCh_012367 [Apium graveolens]
MVAATELAGGNVLSSSSLTSAGHTVPFPVRRRGGVSAMESPHRRTHMDKKKRDFGKSALIFFPKKGKTTMLTSVLLAAANNTILDIGPHDQIGNIHAAVYTIEFQKCGLPHEHIVLWLAEGDKLVSTEDINHIISAKLHDKETDPIGYEAFSQLMMHGPWGEANLRCPCMVNGKCSKFYPRPYTDATTMDSDGYALYRRKDTGITVECNKIHLDKRHVVPYNRGLLVKYQAHINVEQCNKSWSIKYLFKYIDKDPDKVITVMERANRQNNGRTIPIYTSKEVQLDEVKNYLSCRYVSSTEACWRIFEFPIHHREP